MFREVKGTNIFIEDSNIRGMDLRGSNLYEWEFFDNYKYYSKSGKEDDIKGIKTSSIIKNDDEIEKEPQKLITYTNEELNKLHGKLN